MPVRQGFTRRSATAHCTRSGCLWCCRWNFSAAARLSAELLTFIVEMVMAKRSFVQRTQRKVVGAAKETAAYVQKVATRAATAAAMAAAEAAVASVMRTVTKGERGAPARRRKARATARTAAQEATRTPRRKTRRRSSRKASRKRRM